jgi:hypothetical protein
MDAADNIIFHFDKEGRTVGTLGANPEPWTYLSHVIERAVPGRANLYQETNIGWSRDGSIFVADGYGNSRVAKYDKDGNFVKAWGERGAQPGNFNTPHSLVVDNNDVVYVADRGNSRIQTFDTEGNRKAVWNMPTAPWSLCLMAHRLGNVAGWRPACVPAALRPVDRGRGAQRGAVRAHQSQFVDLFVQGKKAPLRKRARHLMSGCATRSAPRSSAPLGSSLQKWK